MELNNQTDDALLLKLKEDLEPEMRQAIESILTDRGFEIEYEETENEGKEKSGNKKSLAATVGLLFILSNFIGLEAYFDFGTLIAIDVSKRLIVFLWLLDLVPKFKSNRLLWGIAGLVFGGWALCIAGVIYLIFGDLRGSDE